jgi:hypothetical protein
MLQAARSANQYRVKAASVPAPVGGLNSRDSIDAMPPTDALIMKQFLSDYRQDYAARWLHAVLYWHWHWRCRNADRA